MKKFFMTIACLALFNVSAMAQSGGSGYSTALIRLVPPSSGIRCVTATDGEGMTYTNSVAEDSTRPSVLYLWDLQNNIRNDCVIEWYTYVETTSGWARFDYVGRVRLVHVGLWSSYYYIDYHYEYTYNP
jgi:hypothetical protein